VIGRANNSARLRLDSVYHLYAPVLSRAAHVSFFADGYEWSVRSGSILRRWSARGRGSKPAPRNQKYSDTLGAPSFSPYRASRPFAHSPFRRTYSPNVLASPFSASSTTSILIKLVLPETLYGVPATIVSTSFGWACRIFTAASALDFTR
jgi:hypothetical protein